MALGQTLYHSAVLAGGGRVGGVDGRGPVAAEDCGLVSLG